MANAFKVARKNAKGDWVAIRYYLNSRKPADKYCAKLQAANPHLEFKVIG